MPAKQAWPKFSDANIKGAFYRAYEETAAKAYLDELAMYVDSDQETESYAWLGNVPVMREWEGGRQLNQPNPYEWTIQNKLYELTLELPVDDIRRDKTGQFAKWAARAGKSAAMNPVRLLSALMVNGESSVCYDGQYFFDTDHQEGLSGFNSNKISFDLSDSPAQVHGTPTRPSAEEMEYAIIEAVTALYSMKDDQAEPVNQDAQEFAIIAPVGYMSSVLAATKSMSMAYGRDNTIKTTDWKFKPYFDARLTTWGSGNKFGVFRTDDPMKPFIHQVELDTDIVYIDDPKADVVFRTRKYQWGASRLEGLGYGDYKKAVLVSLSA